jgi:ribose transport system permease protein
MNADIRRDRRQSAVARVQLTSTLLFARLLGWLVSDGKSLIGLVALIVLASLMSPYFLTADNILNVLRQVSVAGLLALGMTLVILSQGIDLSVGSTLGFAGVLVALCANLDPTLIVLVCLLGGLVCGSLNGLLVAYAGLVSFLVTLATQLVVRGTTLSLTEGRTLIADFPEAINFLGVGYVGPIPVPAIVLVVTYAVFFVVMRYTVFGRRVYAVGGNEEASRLLGIDVRGYRLAIFTISGVLAALGGLIASARLSAGDPSAGLGYELTIIACVAVGGTRFTGGYGGVGLTLIGTLIIGTIDNVLNLMSISPFIQMVVRGIIILVAVWAGMNAVMGARRQQNSSAVGMGR